MYKFIIFCGRYRFFFFFLIVLPWFGNVFSNKGHFGYKRKVPGFLYNHKKYNLNRDKQIYIYISLKLSNIIFGFEAPLQCGNTFIVHPLSVEHGI